MGTMAGLTQYITRFDQLPETDRFLAVESQGDGRALLRAPGWQRGGGSDQALGVVEFSIRPLPMRRDPRDLGTDLAMGDGDLAMENGDLKVVSGEANARQKLRLLVNTPVGGLFSAEEYGVRWRPLALLFGEDLTLLGRLFRLDLARVISAPVRIEELNLPSGTIKSVLKPQIDVVERVEEVVVRHLNPDRSEAIVEIAVIWANGLPWRGQVNVFLSDKPERPVAPSRTPPGPY
ncbi:hypothetical protein [Deinococcus metalli]|nr:hypothetical protein [Deinococcus metalli]